MDNRDREAARVLAISFNAYVEARDAGRDADIFFWAKALLEAQRATRVEILTTDSLLYPLTNDHHMPVAEARARVRLGLTDPPEPSRGVLRSQSGMIEGPDDCDDNGPSPLPVLSPVAPPRQPSPSAALSPASRAAQFYRKG